MSNLFSKVKYFNVLKIPIRYKNPSHHWSVQRKKKPSTKKALDHFDDFYESIYGSSWKNIRSALLNNEHKYVAIVNNFSDPERICEELECMGAMNLKNIYQAYKQNMKYHMELKSNAELNEDVRTSNKSMDEILVEKKIQHSIYPNPYEETTKEKVENEDEYSSFKPVKLQSIESDVNIVKGNNRIISSSAGVASSQLYEFVPATKLKGMDDFVLESDHYNYYNKGADFSVRIETENDLNFPENLNMYIFEEGNFTKFPKAKKGSTQVSDYYVLDAASIFPVLSLDLQKGDTVLDMCAAPGGKTLTALQTLLPRLLVANDIQESRINRINHFVNEFIFDTESLNKKFFITQSDAKFIDDVDIYNKILVDVPCTTDRHVLHEDSNNIFKGTRLKERLRLPEMQSDLLVNALKLVRVGGTVVYSTCSLSPIQNDGVVQMSLKRAFEEFNSVFVVKDQTNALQHLKYLYNFGDFGLKYGHLVFPTKSRNSGPIYFCKMVRVQ